MASRGEASFAMSYPLARERFLAVCADLSLPVATYAHPRRGPDGGEIAVDVARFGPADASRVLVAESGTHGVEGHAGSALQIAWLRECGRKPLANGVAVLFVHALNPWGFAHSRRVNEDNIDLNRSFVDHAAQKWPENPGYEDLKDAFLPREWTPESRRAAEQAMQDYARQHGERALTFAYKYGQHTDPEGLFFGGRKTTWSAGIVARICAEHLGAARKAALIDIHTGLGPFGFGECLSTFGADSAPGARATAWYGDVRHSKDGTGGYSSSSCTIIEGYTGAAPQLEWTPIGLEFGAWESSDVWNAVRADGWLWRYGGAAHPEFARIKAALRNAFCPGDPVWQDMVTARGIEIINRGLAGLAAG